MDGHGLIGGQGHIIALAAGGHIDQLGREIGNLVRAVIQHDGGVIHTGEDVEGVGVTHGGPADKEGHGQAGDEQAPASPEIMQFFLSVLIVQSVPPEKLRHGRTPENGGRPWVVFLRENNL